MFHFFSRLLSVVPFYVTWLFEPLKWYHIEKSYECIAVSKCRHYIRRAVNDTEKNSEENRILEPLLVPGDNNEISEFVLGFPDIASIDPLTNSTVLRESLRDSHGDLLDYCDRTQKLERELLDILEIMKSIN
ncbi:5944_t:CDS:2 [Acaulospora morrowiae]|uniref:5944_t:CDS:1 n=1 Tax=Acaulospora morrowiae TaxID=94023 RepID=A0A9N9EU37_9GLOM|nr:5944_t:CDS:2 [Acaulospora morrowiae]